MSLVTRGMGGSSTAAPTFSFATNGLGGISTTVQTALYTVSGSTVKHRFIPNGLSFDKEVTRRTE